MQWRNRLRVRRRTSGRSHSNYFRDYDPAIGRYIESDPILHPSRDVIDGEWVFAVPLAIRKIRLLLPYAYVADQPIVGSDPRGLFWPLDFIHCLYYSNKYLNAAQDCRRRSGSCSQEQINFMTAYQSEAGRGAEALQADQHDLADRKA
jgi:RHS repeat-associated protein